MSAAEVLKELADLPESLDHLARLNQVAADERRRRERFTEELADDEKAEFINGQIVVHSPARLGHLNASLRVTNLLGNFVATRGRGMIAVKRCFVRCTRNDYEPDTCFFTQAKCAGWELDKKIFPPPDANEYRLHARLVGRESLVSTMLAGFAVPVAAFFDSQENREAPRALLDQR